MGRLERFQEPHELVVTRDERGTAESDRARARYVAIITDGNGRWAPAAACRRWPDTKPARTRSRPGCATPSTSEFAS